MAAGLALLLGACSSTERDPGSNTGMGDAFAGVQEPGVLGPDGAGGPGTGTPGSLGPSGPGAPIVALRDLPSAGITDTEIKVGVDDIHFEEIAGIPITRPPGRQWAEVVIDDLNARGGVAGRRIVPFYYRYESQTFLEREPAACAFYGEDAKVAVVIGQSFGHTPDFLACLAGHNILFIEGGRIDNDAETLDRFPLYANPNWMNMTRAARILAPALVDQGFFGPGSVVGILSDERPKYRRTTEIIVKGLAARGVKVTKVVRMKLDQSSSLADLQAQTSTAVLKMKSPPEANRVIFWSSASFLFPGAAESQHYRPTYGMSTNDWPRTVMTWPGTVKEQLRGLKGVGWFPNEDVSSPERWPAWDRCVALMIAAGLKWSDSNAERGALVHCDLGWLLAAAGSRAGSRLTPATLLAGIEAVGGTFESAAIPIASFGPGRHEGAVAVRDLAYFESCECLRYTSAARRAD
ncbi:MAG: hypothetical protein WEB06_09995 [Actinomycetota bacterium]